MVAVADMVIWLDPAEITEDPDDLALIFNSSVSSLVVLVVPVMVRSPDIATFPWVSIVTLPAKKSTPERDRGLR